MDKPPSRWLKVFIAAMVFLSYLALKSTFQYSRMSLIIPITAILIMPIGEWLDSRLSVYRKVTTLCMIVFTLGLPIMAQSAGLIDTVVSLFIFVQIYSMIHVKAVKNYYHIMLMSFFMLVAALVMSPSASMGVVLLGYLVCAAGCLLMIDNLNHTSNAAQASIDRYALSKSNSRSSLLDRIALIPMFGTLFLVLMGVMTAIFVVMPRTEAGLLGSAVRVPVYTTALSEGVQLDVTGKIASDASAVMRVQFLNVPGGRYEEEKYWRATTMDKYTGISWLRQGLSTRSRETKTGFKGMNMSARDRKLEWLSYGYRNMPSTTGEGRGVRRADMGVGSPVQYEVFVDRYPEGGFPLLSTAFYVAPKKFTQDIRMYWEPGGDYTVNLDYRHKVNPYFTVVSVVLNPTARDLRSSIEDYMDVMVPSDYRLLTEQNLGEESLALTRDITQRADTNYDRVALIESYLSGAKYQYTKDIPLLNPVHPIDSFINDVKSGHCELFASSMALMVRSLGIPTRVVSGYRGGTWDEDDQSYTITNNMAHLWVEVYFPDFGWINFDPSPAVSDVEIGRLERIQNVLAKYSLQARILWMNYVVGFSPNDSFVLMRDKAFRLVGNVFASNSEEETPEAKVNIFERIQGLLFLLFLLAAFGLLVLQIYRFIRGTPKLVRVSLTADQTRVKRLYMQLISKLEGMGIASQNRTAEELMARLKEVSESQHYDLQNFVQQYHDVRFGSKKMTTKELAHYGHLIRGL